MVLSRGKRDRKRKRKAEEKPPVPKPPPPAQSTFIDVGIPSISRTLEALSSSPSDSEDLRLYSAVFVVHGPRGQSSALTTHFPIMVSVASSAHESKPPIHLVGLPEAAENRLSDALGIPRVSSVAIREACPSSDALLGFLRNRVPIVEIPWLQEAGRGVYKATKIKKTDIPVGTKKGARKTLPICTPKELADHSGGLLAWS